MPMTERSSRGGPSRTQGSAVQSASAVTPDGYVATSAHAEWSFSTGAYPNAFIQTDRATIELQCDRVRFAPAGYEDSKDIVSKQGLSFRFMSNGSTETGAFQAGASNAEISIVDNYPVEIRFYDKGDYDFVLDQIARNAVLNLSMIDQDVTYGIFTLQGSSAAVRSLRAACNSGASASQSPAMEVPEGIVYCGGAIQRVIEYAIVGQSGDQWDAIVTVNGEDRPRHDRIQLLRKLPAACRLPVCAPGRRPVRVPSLQRRGAELDRVGRLRIRPVQLNRTERKEIRRWATNDPEMANAPAPEHGRSLSP